MIKYINMQTALCPKCKCNNITARCSREHLKKCHEFRIDDAHEIIDQMKEASKENLKTNKQNNTKKKA